VVAAWAGLDCRVVSGLALTIHASADAVLEHVHFDLHDSSGSTSRALALYAFRPAAALGLAYSF
jgi:hypothetical protein